MKKVFIYFRDEKNEMKLHKDEAGRILFGSWKGVLLSAQLAGRVRSHRLGPFPSSQDPSQ